MSEPKWVFAFDPGEKNIGWAMFKYDAEKRKADLRRMTIIRGIESLFPILDTLDGLASKLDTTFVIENFRIDNVARTGRSAMKFQWSEMETIRIIGMVQYLAHRTKSSIVFQEPRILNMGKRWCDFKLPKGHIPDDKSAYIHGAHFMMNAGWIDTVDDILKNGQEKLV